MLVREEVLFAAHVGHLQESQALSSERLGSPALYFPVQSDPLEKGYRLCARACLITADLYTTIGMVSIQQVSRSLMTNWLPSICPGIPSMANGTIPSSLRINDHLIYGTSLRAGIINGLSSIPPGYVGRAV